jgi:hypothetical protein
MMVDQEHQQPLAGLVTPPAGYRLLNEGEPIHADDIYLRGGKWLLTNSHGEHWNPRDFWPMARQIPGAVEQHAREFATRHHESINHRRKYTDEPYITHPAAVVELVRGVTHTETMLAAAWLHDVVEDTNATLAEVEQVFGVRVASQVEMLTDISKPEDGNRAARKAIDRAHTAKASPEAKTIKLADLIDNSRTILAHDPKFAKVYLEEKRQLLDVLQEGDYRLMKMAKAILAGNNY